MTTPMIFASRPPAWLARLWEVGGVVGGGAVLAAAVVLWMAAGSWVSAFDRSLGITTDALGATVDTLALVDETMETLGNSSLRLRQAVLDAGETSQAVATVAAQTSVLLGEQLPADIDAIRASIDGLIDTANVIDGVLGALAFVGVDYDPAVPLDEALIELDDRIADLPIRFRSQAESLAAVAEGIESFSGDAETIAADIDDLRSQMLGSRSVLATYRATTDQAITSVVTAREELGATRRWVRLVAVAGGLVGLTAMSAVWWLGRASRQG